MAEAATTCTVACKLPNGLQLVLHRFHEVQEPIMGGGTRAVQKSRAEGPRVLIHGAAYRVDKAPAHTIVGGYGLTPNVDAAFFAEWMKQNADTDMVRNHLIFALAKPESAAAKAKEQALLRSGLEPIDPKMPPVRGVTTATTTV